MKALHRNKLGRAFLREHARRGSLWTKVLNAKCAIAWIATAIAGGFSLILGGFQVYNYCVAPFVSYNVTGTWCVVDEIRKSSLDEYVGLVIEFKLVLSQEGKQIKGWGKKYKVNGVAPRPKEDSKIKVDMGIIENNKITLAFIEETDARPDRKNMGGIFKLEVKDEKTLEGEFENSAANTRGTVRAHRCS